MARQMERLSPGKVQKVTASKPGKPEFVADGRGLYLRIGATGSKSWIFRYMLGGKSHDMGVGPYPEIGLAEARERCMVQRRIKLDGADPIGTRRAERLAQSLADAKATTFEQAAAAYVRAHRAGWKSPKSLAAWEHTLSSFAYPIIGKLAVQAIDTDLVMKVLEQTIDDGPDDKPASLWNARAETASRLRGRLESILDYAKVKGQRQGENPARWRGHLENLLPKKTKVRQVVHYAALPYDELPAFMAQLRAQSPIAARALEFTILTAARTGEVLSATSQEIKEKVWTVPAGRMKGGKEHRVPLAAPALAIVERTTSETADAGKLLFPGLKRGRPLSNMAMLKLLARCGRSDLTVHGFRSTFRDWAAERTNFPREVIEMALAHTIDSKVEAAYRRGDLFEKRRQLAEAWARYCCRIATDSLKGVSIR